VRHTAAAAVHAHTVRYEPANAMMTDDGRIQYGTAMMSDGSAGPRTCDRGVCGGVFEKPASADKNVITTAPRYIPNLRVENFRTNPFGASRVRRRRRRRRARTFCQIY